MTKSEIRMTKENRNPKPEVTKESRLPALGYSSFGNSFVIMVSSLVIPVHV